MRGNFPLALKYVLAHEGGKVDHPKDPGGRTNQGVTQRVYDAYRKRQGLPARDVWDMKASERDEIYKYEYWDRVQADYLPSGLDYAVFDYAVNSGVQRAAKDLQRTFQLNLVDGQIGSGTLAAIGPVVSADHIKAYCNRRMAFLKALKNWKTFGKGWKRRVMGDLDGYQAGDHGVIDYSINLLKTVPEVLPLPSAIGSKDGELAGKAVEKKIAVTKTKDGVGAIGAGTGVAGTYAMNFAEQVQPHIGETLVGRLALAAFILLSIAGFSLVVYSFYRRFKERGGSLKDLL